MTASDALEDVPSARLGRRVLIVASLWVLIHLAGAAGLIGAHTLRSVHLGGAVLLTFAMRPLPGPGRLLDAGLALVTVIAVGYLIVHSDAIQMANWFTRPVLERTLGVGLFLALAEAVRRALGIGFVAMIFAFIAYALFGDSIPGPLGHRGLSGDRLIFSFYLGTQGVFGMLIGISAGVVALFLIFGELLNAGGAGRTFINIALSLGGRVRGGAGLVAVIGSAFMGMINGSSVANVASTGVLTIPLMRRLGFSRNLSGSIEAVASTGGQFMPPIMGPGAFLMAELLGIAYVDVAVAALIPSTLFYIGLLLAVRLLAGRENLAPIPAELIPPRSEVYAPMALIALLVPIGLLVGMVIASFTVQYAVLWAIAASLVLMAVALVADRTEEAPRVVPAYLDRLAGALDASARNIAYVGMIIAAAQVLVGIINLTGLGATLSQIVVALGQQNLILSMILAMAVAILLGMGMPTPAAYAVAAAVLAPPLSRLGLETLPAHLFIYYFACLAAITPPVCAAIFAACAISGGKVLGTARQAFGLSVSLYLIPFLFVTDPVLLMQGPPLEVALACTTAAIGVGFLTVATIGYLRTSVPPVARVCLALAAGALLIPGWVSDLGGLAFGGAVCATLLRSGVRP